MTATATASPILKAADTLEGLGYRVVRLSNPGSNTYAPAGDALRAYHGSMVVTIFPTYSGGLRVAGYVEYDATGFVFVRQLSSDTEYKTAAGAIRKAREILR